MKKPVTVRRRVFVQPSGTCEPHLATAVVLTLLLSAARGQEALRNSITEEPATNAIPAATADDERYTLKSGDFRMLLTPSIDLAWNDNVYTSHQKTKDDYILTPLLGVQMSYPLTAHNQLSLDAGVGYEKYFMHDDLSAWMIRSGSQLAFDLYVKDVWINFHDRFEYARDSAREAAVANTAKYGNINNLAGLQALWNLHDVVLSAGYDHQNIYSPSSEFENQDHSAELFFGRAGFRVHPQVVVGAEATGALTTYDHPVLNDNTAFSAGGYGTFQLGSTVQIQSRAGYAAYQYDHTSKTIQTSDVHSWYAELAVSHQPTEPFRYSLTAGHEARLGVQADMIEDYYVRPGIDWDFAEDWSFGAVFSYEHGRQGVGNISGSLTETYDWCGTDFLLSRQIMKRLRADLGYRLTLRDSSESDRKYTQNLVHVNLTYEFR